MKKLLLILLCLPFIGFGQDDKIIFSSGDTIIGKVIEVGVYDITYQHKGENINYNSKKREIAKVIFSSGRIESFQGLKKLQKITKEKIIVQNFKKSLELGVVSGLTSSNFYGKYRKFLEDVNFEVNNLYSSNIGISLNHNFSPLISFNSKLIYNIKGNILTADFIATDVTGNILGSFLSKTKYKHQYITIPIITKFNVHNNFSLNTGIYSSYLMKIVEEITFPKGQIAGGITFPADTVITNTVSLDGYNRFDIGLVLGSSFSYAINNNIRFTFDANLEYGLINSFNFKNNNPRYNIAYNLQIGCLYRIKQ